MPERDGQSYAERNRARIQAGRSSGNNSGGSYGGPDTGNSGGTFVRDGNYRLNLNQSGTFGGGNGRNGNNVSFGDNPLLFLANGYDEYAVEPLTRFNNSNRGLVRSQRLLGNEQERQFRDQSGLSTREVNLIQRNQYLANNPEAAMYLAAGRNGVLPQGGIPQGGVAPQNPYAQYGQYGQAGGLPPQYRAAPNAQVDGAAPPAPPAPPVTATAPDATAPGATAPAATTTAGTTAPAATAPGGTTAETPAPGATAPAAASAPTLATATGAAAPLFGVRRQAAPRANEIPKIAQNQVEALQDLLIAAGHSVGAMGSDGKYGPNTHNAIKSLAATLTPPITDLTTIDFTNPQDPETQRFMTALQPRATAPAVAAAPAGPTPDQIAERQRQSAVAAARAAEAQRQAEIERGIPESIRGTPFDPRNLARMSQEQRYDLARTALAGIDELASPNSRPNPERMHDKMDESVRYANERLGTRIARPSEADPLSVDAMVALGLRAANEGRLSNNRNQIVELPENMTQAQMNAAAVQYIRALDRGVDREDPSRAIRRFEERDMGRSGIEVDGLADPAMLAALRQAVAVRNGLSVVTAEAPPAPASAPAAAAPAPQLPASVSGGETVGGQPVNPGTSPAAAPAPVAGRSTP